MREIKSARSWVQLQSCITKSCSVGHWAGVTIWYVAFSDHQSGSGDHAKYLTNMLLGILDLHYTDVATRGVTHHTIFHQEKPPTRVSGPQKRKQNKKLLLLLVAVWHSPLHWTPLPESSTHFANLSTRLQILLTHIEIWLGTHGVRYSYASLRTQTQIIFATILAPQATVQVNLHDPPALQCHPALRWHISFSSSQPFQCHDDRLLLSLICIDIFKDIQFGNLLAGPRPLHLFTKFHNIPSSRCGHCTLD